MYKKYKPSKEYLTYLDSLPKSFFVAVLENSYNEHIVYDADGKILYVNPACIRHYGLKPEEMINRNNADVYQGYWTPPGLDIFHSKKDTAFLRQYFIPSDSVFYTIGVPVLNEDHCIEMIIGTVQEEPVKEWDVDYNKKSRSSKSHFKSEELPLISVSYQYWKIVSELKEVSESSIPIMLLGESGTGKTYMAKYIHENSHKEGLFMALNCAAIPEALLESELFGYAGGAFTGASKDGKVGLIEMANEGTLFLDEIGDMPLSIQAKLLDVIENKRYLPVGSTKMKYVNTRIITATNKNIDQLVDKGEFREDLYWRICTFKAIIPPLRERVKDILPLANFFLKHFNLSYNKSKRFSKEIINFFQEYPWPGNIRQLKNLIERLVVTGRGNEIAMKNLPDYLLEETKRLPDYQKTGMGFNKRVDAFKKELVQKAYEQYPTIRKLAQALEVSPTTAQRLVEKYCKEISERSSEM